MTTRFSFEFFPPKTEAGAERLLQVHQQLVSLGPEYCSVTYGAGGSTRERTLNTVLAMSASSVPVAPHLSCIGDSRESLKQILGTYRQAGVHRLVALRGDLPSGQVGLGELPYAADLVAFIRESYGQEFHIEVAAYPETHPQAENFEQDLRYFLAKVNAGADAAITQYFYNIDAYWHFCERVRQAGCSIDIVPGIMPITQYSNLMRFSEACGAEIPRWLRKQLAAYADDQDSIRQLGEEVVTRLCQRLLEQGVPSLHFYTMNQLEPCRNIVMNLGLQT
ncbi:MAG: methylenetetrahydrofolate reductase [NAD(P)H] [Pseudomonadales bacterium]|nr:methylenetetrahydrofolate reductase [NAD(P)H] [Pseudomonadales bacterium]